MAHPQEQPAIWKLAVNILNKQSETADEWSLSLGVGQIAYSSSTYKHIMLQTIQKGLGPGSIL
jgi:hypothetical protein